VKCHVQECDKHIFLETLLANSIGTGFLWPEAGKCTISVHQKLVPLRTTRDTKIAGSLTRDSQDAARTTGLFCQKLYESTKAGIRGLC
jgi:hypothetical protein